jgi:hypothetical protein
MRVEAVEARGREGLGHQQRGVAVAAADVGHADAGFELRHHAVQRRQPLRHQRGPVAVAVEGRHTAGHARVVLAPGHAAAGAKRLQRLGLVEPHRRRHVPRGRNEHGAVFVGQHQRVLGRELVGVAHRVVAQVLAGSLGVEPLAHIALGAAGAPRQLLRAQRPGAGQGLVQAQLVAQADHHAGVAGGDVAHGPHDEGLDLRVVDHGGVHEKGFLVLRGGRGAQGISGGRAWATAWPTLRPCSRPSFTACLKWMPA